MKRKYLQHVVTFGGERMTRGEMIRRLQQTARATGHPNPRLLVDRYLQGWEAGLTLADHAELWCQEQGRELPPRCTPEWSPTKSRTSEALTPARNGGK